MIAVIGPLRTAQEIKTAGICHGVIVRQLQSVLERTNSGGHHRLIELERSHDYRVIFLERTVWSPLSQSRLSCQNDGNSAPVSVRHVAMKRAKHSLPLHLTPRYRYSLPLVPTIAANLSRLFFSPLYFLAPRTIGVLHSIARATVDSTIIEMNATAWMRTQSSRQRNKSCGAALPGVPVLRCERLTPVPADLSELATTSHANRQNNVLLLLLLSLLSLCPPFS